MDGEGESVDMNTFDRLGRHVADELDDLRARSPDRATARERIAALDVAPPRPRRRDALVTLAAAALIALGALGVLRARQPKALTATFGPSNQPAVVGAWLEASEVDPLPVKFSEGTRIDIAPRSRARLVELGPSGAHLSLEGGHARVDVAKKPHAAWLLSVGPFAVRVTGTRFDLRWEPDKDEFELDLEEGHVELAGCVFGEAYRLSAGEVARASCKHAYLQILDRKSAARAVEPAPTVAQAPAIEPAAPPHGDKSRERPEAARSPAEDRARFRELAEQGKYAEALAAASASGFESQCQHANAEELALLGDTARLAGDGAKASRAFQVLRRRFSGTAKAAEAAFALGRLEFDGPGSYGKAADWFKTYLREQPNGRLAREARGRLMEALHRAGDERAARDAAVQYLRDFPSGPHAALAKDIRGSTEP
jgi:hypothetical protein